MSRIGIIVDNPKRDLNGLLLVAVELCKLKHEVVLIPMYNQFNDALLLGLDVIVVNYLRPANADLLRFYRSIGTKVAIMDTEGGLFSESGSHSAESWAKRVSEYKMQDCVDEYYFWGEKIYLAYKQFSGLTEKSLKLTGCPRFDLCFEPYRKLTEYEHKNYVLINTNFAACNPKFVTSEEVERQNVVKAGHSLEWATRYLADQKQTLAKTIDELKKMLQVFPNEKFLLRPHPFEGEVVYRSHLSEFANLIIESKGEVFSVINNAKKLIHVGCGTAVEALLFNKPSYCMNYVMSNEYSKVNPLPAKISMDLKSTEDLLNAVSSDLVESEIQNRVKNLELISGYFGPLDGCNHKRVALAVHNLTSNNSNQIKNTPVITFLKYTIFMCSFKRALINTVILLIGSFYVENIRCLLSTNRKSKYASNEQLEIFKEKFNLYVEKSNIKFENRRHLLPFLKMKSIEIKVNSST